MLSVIIPTCNRSRLLDRCLEKLTPSNQLLSNCLYEVIVTDDSTDNLTEKLIKEKYQWVKWLPGPKRGPAANRNSGAEYAIGDWLVFTDDDCLPAMGWLSSYQEAINEMDFKVYEGLTDADRPKERFDEQSPININGGRLWSCNFSIEKRFFFELGGFDGNFPYPALEDTDLHLRIIKRAQICFLPEAKIIHPWRSVGFFKGYYKWLSSNKYFITKYNTDLDLGYRLTRTKIFLANIYYHGKELVRFSFKGFFFYFEMALFDFLMIFIRK